MLDDVFAANQRLKDRLIALIEQRAIQAPAGPRSHVMDGDPSLPLDVVVTMNEVNSLHGTGPLVKRLYHGRKRILSIRARDDWGVHEFGDWNVCLSPRSQTRAQAFRNVLAVLGGYKVKSVLCVPFLPDEVLTSIAIHECFGAALCVYIMDDQNIASHGIPDSLMRELLERASLCLATHPELASIYQRKYGLPVSVLPALAPADLVSNRPKSSDVMADERRAVLLGSFWDQSWFDRLCSGLAGCDWTIDWFGNSKSPWLVFAESKLRRAGITAHGILPEDQLALELSKRLFTIVPVGALDEHDTNRGVAQLSLPGRILFAVAASHSPVLVVGSSQTCGARFVRHFDVGEVAPYDPSSISGAMRRISDPAAQERMRRNAARIAESLSDRGIVEWLRRSIELGKAADSRFEDLFVGYDSALE